jgi:hypothetical protein
MTGTLNLRSTRRADLMVMLVLLFLDCASLLYAAFGRFRRALLESRDVFV